MDVKDSGGSVSGVIQVAPQKSQSFESNLHTHKSDPSYSGPNTGHLIGLGNMKHDLRFVRAKLPKPWKFFRVVIVIGEWKIGSS